MRKKLLQFLIPVFLLVFIRYVGFFMFGILPLSFNLLTLKTEYNINHKKLKLSESYSITDCGFKNYVISCPQQDNAIQLCQAFAQQIISNLHPNLLLIGMLAAV